ncbi:MAG: methionyl-tRNA formyltransferase [bacterium]
MKLIFMGTPEFASTSLLALIENRFDLLAVVTQPDRPKGRGKILTTSPVKKIATSHNLPVLQPEKIRHIKDELADLAPDCIVVVAYGQILTEEILRLPPLGCVNLHASLLPAYRGASPIQWAIIKGETITGVTTISMDKGMDTGNILLQKKIPIAAEDTARSLHDKLAAEGASLLIETLHALRDGSITPAPQDHSKASYAPMLKKSDGLINWAHSAADIVNLIRGCDPWPSTFTYHGAEMIKIWKAVVSDEKKTDAPPGTVVKINAHALYISTGEEIVAILELQREGKKRQDVDSFLRGYSIKTGDKFSLKQTE